MSTAVSAAPAKPRSNTHAHRPRSTGDQNRSRERAAGRRAAILLEKRLCSYGHTITGTDDLLILAGGIKCRHCSELADAEQAALRV